MMSEDAHDAVVSNLQCYQSTIFATVSFILAEQYRGKVQALFEKDCCKLLVEDEPIWQLELRYSIDPSKSKLTSGKRTELKLRKVIQQHWDDWEAKALPTTTLNKKSTS